MPDRPKQKIGESVAIALKGGLTRIGARFSDRTFHRLNATMDYLWSGHWMKANGFAIDRRVKHRCDLFDIAIADAPGKRPLYLEFGVYRGRSIKYWAEHLSDPDARFHGFDTFEGLPEDWNPRAPAAFLNRGGKVPQIDDPRVTFHKGLFQDTLPTYQVPPHDFLFLNIDADLYSSAKTVLEHLGSLLVPGSYLYFDEFGDRDHELRAYEEFVARTKMTFRLVAASQSLAHVLFQRI